METEAVCEGPALQSVASCGWLLLGQATTARACASLHFPSTCPRPPPPWRGPRATCQPGLQPCAGTRFGNRVRGLAQLSSPLSSAKNGSWPGRTSTQASGLIGLGEGLIQQGNERPLLSTY